jgi:hypothetical protein
MMTKLESAILSILDDDHGINSVAYLRLRDSLQDTNQYFWKLICRELNEQSGRFFLPIGAARRIAREYNGEFDQ